MHSEGTEEDIYDFSGVSYDLTSLRSELMQFREKGKPRFSSGEKNYGISEKNYNYVLPSSSAVLSRSVGSDSHPPKLPPKEKDINRRNNLYINGMKRNDKMMESMDSNHGDVSDCVTINNKGLGLNYQINGIFVNNMTRGQNDYANITSKDDEDDDEEWYPPSPPIYDVAEKLIEVNRMLYDDPTSLIRNGPGKLRWKPDSYLVQVRWLYAGGDVYEDENDEHLFYHDDPDQHDQDLDDYSDDCDHEPSPPPPSRKSGGHHTNSSKTNTVNSQTFIENFGRQLNLIPMPNNNPSPPIMMDSYDIDSDEKTISPNAVGPLPSEKFLSDSNIVSDSLNERNAVNITTKKQDFEYGNTVNVNGGNATGNDNNYKKENEVAEPFGYVNDVPKSNMNGVRDNIADCSVKNNSNNNVVLRKSPSPNAQLKTENTYETNGDTLTKVNSSEEDDSISCRTLNGDGGDSNEENLISQRIDLNRRYMEDERNSTSPSSMSSNLSQHSQSSILNLINSHEAKRTASNSGIKNNKKISPPNGISIKGSGVSRHVSMSCNNQVLSKSPILSPSKTKTKIVISKNGHSHTKEPNSLLSNSQIRPSNKETNSNIAKKSRGNYREKILLNGDSDSSSSRNQPLQKRLSTPTYPPLPPLYRQSSSSPSSTPPPLPEKTLSNGISKSVSAHTMLHPDGCNSDPTYSLSTGRPKPSLSPYTRSRISKTTSDNSLQQASKFGIQRNVKLSTNVSSNVHIRSHRTSSLSRSGSNSASSSSGIGPSIGLGKRDSFSNRSSAMITASLSSNSNDMKRHNSLANSRRSNSSGLIELKSSNRRRSSATKPPPLPIMTRAAPSTRPLQRKVSRNSLSSNSSVSSQTTEDTSATTGSSGVSSGSNGIGMISTSSGISSMSSSSSLRRRSGLSSTSSAVNGSGYLDTDSSYLKWKVRKREEKRLKERRDYLECQLRRY